MPVTIDYGIRFVPSIPKKHNRRKAKRDLQRRKK